jgi:PadR family transcriptional regulator AphA
MLKYALLGMLNYQPMSGYRLKNTLDRSTSYFWNAELSQIYRTLKALERAGLVSSSLEAQDARPDQRVYTVTEAGRRDLLDWLATPLLDLETQRITLLLKLFFARPIGKTAILTQLRIQRDLYARRLDQIKTEAVQEIQAFAAIPEWAADGLLWETTRRYGELGGEAILCWLDESIERIETTFPEEER